jgi:hypothetical protein
MGQMDGGDSLISQKLTKIDNIVFFCRRRSRPSQSQFIRLLQTSDFTSEEEEEQNNLLQPTTIYNRD